MSVLIISGSQRPRSNSMKVAQHVEALLYDPKVKGSDATLSSNILELGTHPLPLWDDSPDTDNARKLAWTPIAEKVKAATGFIVICPEWSGMVPAALKNFFLYCNPQLLGHKPALIIGVSSGMGGAYPVAELRSSSYKNTRLCYLPEHLIIRKVDEFLHDYDSELLPETSYLKGRMQQSLRLFLAYREALALLREKNTFDFKLYPNGM